MKSKFIAMLALAAAPAFSTTLPTRVSSPDGQLIVKLDQNADGQITYAVERHGETVITPSALRVVIKEGDLSRVDLQQAMPRTVQRERKLIATKASAAHESFNEVTLTARPRSHALNTFDWIVRVYDDGVAFRYWVPSDAGVKTLAVLREESEFTFGGDYDCHGLNIGRVDSSHEGEFDPVKSSHIRDHNLYDLPLVCRTGKNAFAIAEANLVDYGGLYLAGRGDGKPGVQPRVSRRLDDKSLIARVDVGADGAGSPWRVIMVADK